MKYLFALWMAALRSTLLNIFENNNADVFDSIFDCIRRSFLIYIFVNTVFYAIEMIIWGHGFLHFGDTILHFYLAVEFGISIYVLITFKRTLKGFLLA